MSENKKCKTITGNQYLMDGWGCCQCSTYNGDARNECKYCSHERCDNPTTKTVPIKEEGGIKVVKIKVPEKNTGKAN